ncbi:DUF4262 domain-containing protein [Kutzneria viridogrisea]|uniref:DUF4262 domain-containing protein n=1 Tax=Kutzneria viridogrisea TaxID=47990 RepID=A0ABR6BLH2_9PSEU|nr:hypothetical protein [Kutzneria viridogrisea]
MCWQCDHPDLTFEDYLNRIRQIIHTRGWAVQYVEQHEASPPWAYTVGLTEHGRPELVLTGGTAEFSAALLNVVGGHLLHAEPPDPGEQLRFDDGTLVEVVAVTEPAAHLNVAVAMYGDDIQALQLVHADGRGQWPWDSDYRGGRGGQPVLGERHR